jgi:hypothetical protein
MIEADATSTDWSSSRIFSRGGSVLAPPGILMLALPEVPRNAERAKSEGPRQRREKSAAQGVIEAGAFGLWPGCLGCYSSSMKVISRLTL